MKYPQKYIPSSFSYSFFIYFFQRREEGHRSSAGRIAELMYICEEATLRADIIGTGTTQADQNIHARSGFEPGPNVG